MHVSYVSVDLINVRHESAFRTTRLSHLTIQDVRFAQFLIVKIVDILSDQHRFYLTIRLLTVFLELSHCSMTSIRVEILNHLNEIVVPLPACIRVFLKEFSREHSLRIQFPGIFLFRFNPHATWTSKGRNTTRITDASSSQYCNFLLTNQVFSCLFASAFEWIFFFYPTELCLKLTILWHYNIFHSCYWCFEVLSNLLFSFEYREFIFILLTT